MIRLEAAAGAAGPVHGDEQGFPFRFHVDFLVLYRFSYLFVHVCLAFVCVRGGVLSFMCVLFSQYK